VAGQRRNLSGLDRKAFAYLSFAVVPTDVFTAISDPTRRGLLRLLEHGERPVKALAGEFAMTRPAVSQHLRILREAGLVRERRVGRERRYRLHARPLREVSDWVELYERFWDDRLAALGEELDRLAEQERGT
jgi:DNA-binding transcriptional ArsR family regulator